MNITISLPDDEETRNDLLDAALYGADRLREDHETPSADAIVKIVEAIKTRLL